MLFNRQLPTFKLENKNKDSFQIPLFIPQLVSICKQNLNIRFKLELAIFYFKQKNGSGY